MMENKIKMKQKTKKSEKKEKMKPIENETVGIFLDSRALPFLKAKDYSQLKWLNSQIRDLEKEIAYERNDAYDVEIKTKTKSAQESLSSLQKAQQQHKRLESLIKETHLAISKINESLQPLYSAQHELSFLEEYFSILRGVEKVGSTVKIALDEISTNGGNIRSTHPTLSTGSIIILSNLLNRFLKLSKKYKFEVDITTDSSIDHQPWYLASLIESRLSYLVLLIKDSYMNDLKESLADIGWPITSRHKMLPTEDNILLFQTSLKNLVIIQSALINSYKSRDLLARKQSKDSLPDTNQSRDLPDKCSIDTNRIDKPEWYHTFLLNVIHDHSDFIEKYLKPVIDDAMNTLDTPLIDVTHLFIDCVLDLLCDKIRADYNNLRSESPESNNTTQIHQFRHHITEIIKFQNEMKRLYDYTCFIITSLNLVDDWINIETHFITGCASKFLHAHNAWDSVLDHATVTVLDESIFDKNDQSHSTRPSFAVDCIFSLLSNMTERCEAINTMSDRYKFISVVSLPVIQQTISAMQNELNTSLERMYDPNDIDSTTNPNGDWIGLWKHYCSVLNSVEYCSEILLNWNDEIFYVRLRWYEMAVKKKEEEEMKLIENENENENENEKGREEDIIEKEESNMNQTDEELRIEINASDLQIHKLQQVSGSVFDLCLKQLRKYQTDFTIVFSELILEEFRRTMTVTSTTFMCSEPPLGQASPCFEFTNLKSQLSLVEKHLSPRLHNQLLKKLAEIMDEHIYFKIVRSYYFSKFGAKHFSSQVEILISIFEQIILQPRKLFPLLSDTLQLFQLSESDLTKLRAGYDEQRNFSQITFYTLEIVRTILTVNNIKMVDPLDAIEFCAMLLQ